MHLTAEHYREAALERIAAAQNEYRAKRYADCIYLAGLATEAILRAYRCRINPEFDSRHDLADLMRASGLEDLVPAKRRQEVGVLLGKIWARWKNDYRFASNDRLTADLRKRDLCDGIKGDPLKANALTILNSALELVGIGDTRWDFKKT